MVAVFKSEISVGFVNHFLLVGRLWRNGIRFVLNW